MAGGISQSFVRLSFSREEEKQPGSQQKSKAAFSVAKRCRVAPCWKSRFINVTGTPKRFQIVLDPFPSMLFLFAVRLTEYQDQSSQNLDLFKSSDGQS